MRTRSPIIFAALLLFGSACAGSHQTTDVDAGAGPIDLGSSPDLGHGLDLGTIDSGSSRSCYIAMDVAPDPCTDIDCAPGEPRRYFWDGYECAAWPLCTSCVGADCGLLNSLEGCEAAHSSCSSVLCEATGGYFRAEQQYCGNFVCGHAGPRNCVVPTPACDCGLGKIYDDDLGCVESIECGAEDLCAATHGTWRVASFDACGVEIDLPAAAPTCDCGSGFIFDTMNGCTPALIDICVGPTMEDVCRRSSGSWIEGCASVCGTAPLLCDCDDCYSCQCPRYHSFDYARGGCVRDESCEVRGQTSSECDSDAQCLAGLACCAGGASIQGHCEAIRCDPAGACGPPRP